MTTGGDLELAMYFTDILLVLAGSKQFSGNVDIPHNIVPPNFEQTPVFNMPQIKL